MADQEEEILDNGYSLDRTQEQRLITVLNDLEEEVEKQNSFKWVFLRGTLQGLGIVIGSTVLITLLVSVIALFVDTFGLEDIPFVGDFIEQTVNQQLEGRSN